MMQSDLKPPTMVACRLERIIRRRRAFTLLETLVVIAIIVTLLALLLPAIRSARSRMKALKCSSNMRTVAFRFQLFAEDTGLEDRGDSEQLGTSRFFANDFHESLYKIDEFWDLGDAAWGRLSARRELLMCPAGPRQLIKRRGFPCSGQAIRPPEDVTLAMNMRLYRAVVDFKSHLVLAPAAATHVRADVLSHPYVPLVLDVDGRAAVARGVEPFYTAPPVRGTTDPYSTGWYWMPSKRHDGRTIVAFVGGHVLSSTQAERETWDWEYQAEVGN